jgi:hypothetical protein
MHLGAIVFEFNFIPGSFENELTGLVGAENARASKSQLPEEEFVIRKK